MSEMKKGWEIKKLGEVCDVITKGTTPTSLGFNFTDEGVNFIKVESLTETGQIIPNKVAYISNQCHESLKRSQLKENDILFSIAGALGRIGIVNKEILPANTNQALAIVRIAENSGVSVSFLAKYFTSSIISDEIEILKGGAAQQNLSLGQLNNLSIPIPPLPEQQRIVSILDKAFTAIEKAKANAEKNLKNAKELFESYLQGVFENKGEGWEEQVLEDCFKMKSGDNLTAKNMIEGSYPVFGGNGIAGYHKEYNLSGSNVIIGRVGALCGNVRHITINIWLTDNAFKVVDCKFEFDHSFLTYMLNYKDLRGFARQAAQPVISNSSLKDVVLYFPKSIIEQQTIVRKLDALRLETKKLEAIYQQKINDLEELKKSVLQKAFSGKLGTNIRVE
jgi:type I restriction enzyme S subunit